MMMMINSLAQTEGTLQHVS